MDSAVLSNFAHPVSPRWCEPSLVERFRTNAPNEVLLRYARTLQEERGSAQPLRALDIGGGAGRNAVPLAKLGFQVVCIDLAMPMLHAAQSKRHQQAAETSVHLARSPMTPLPFGDAQFDLIIAHGIWNLANSGLEFRCGVAEAARVAKPKARLFLFTFSRHTIPDDAPPIAGESFVFDQFNGEPQCFLREKEILEELESAGFVRDVEASLTEYNCPSLPCRSVQRPPVIYEGTFVKAGGDGTL
jgi:ubiquinone/menaquinone biosynthesis C-methylase UbiE